MKAQSAKLKANFLMKALRAIERSSLIGKEEVLVTAEMVVEYVDEAEHQDGEDYWMEYFNNASEILDDLARYIECASSTCKPIIPE